jgi:hypothetical protein
MEDIKNHVKYSNNSLLTGEEVYNRVYFEKLIIILTGATTYLVGVLSSEFIRILMNKIIKPDDKVYPIVLGIIIVFIILIAVNLFTYQKINTDKDNILKQLTGDE